jgi:DNA invertase Pin-like site-specific DNA recombinase
MVIGYARISTPDQTAALAAQEKLLNASGVGRVFTEQASAVANRPVLKACLRFLRAGDQLIVTTPARLAGSATDLLAINADLEKRDIGLIVLSIQGLALDSHFPANKQVLEILAGVAEWEREILSERQRGDSARKSQSRGRPPSINPDDVRALVGTMSVTKIARQLKISRASAYRLLRPEPPGSA